MISTPLRMAFASVAMLLLYGAAAAGEMTSQPVAQPPAEPQPPARPLLYFFEHKVLPEAAFRYDRDLQALIANPRQAGQPVTRMFSKAVLYSVRVPTFNSEAVPDDMLRFMRQIGFETVRQGGYTIHLMRMPPPEQPAEAYYVAIVYKDGEPLVEGVPAPSTRYIAFEKTAVPGRAYALGEWDVNGKHTTHGFGNQEPTLRDVVVNVYALLGIAVTVSPQAEP